MEGKSEFLYVFTEQYGTRNSSCCARVSQVLLGRNVNKVVFDPIHLVHGDAEGFPIPDPGSLKRHCWFGASHSSRSLLHVSVQL